ncbi:RNA-guided endonuclease TnpB family protein [Actinomadura adrarensis]|uniref:RNA-guided endonuclease TnpB family protein n=1 Tax=Actinomadura adrarensis TaxID=1819600 RepID=A0ABW3CB66_9ACTN
MPGIPRPRAGKTSYKQTDAALTSWKKTDELAFLSEVSSVPLQQTLANRRKAKAKVARAHRKVRDARTDFLHRTSTRLVQDNDVIAVEDLNVSGMVKNRRLARSISDCGWGEFRRQLEYKAARHGRRLVVVDRWYPSSRTCSHCGHLLAELSLSTRHWTCPGCRTRHDRDVNGVRGRGRMERGRALDGRPVRRAGPGLRCDGRRVDTPAGACETSGDDR